MSQYNLQFTPDDITDKLKGIHGLEEEIKDFLLNEMRHSMGSH